MDQQKADQKSLMDRLVRLSATIFYVGEIPWAPGTLGSFVGLLLFLSVRRTPWICAFVFGLLIILGVFSAGRAERIFGRKDPREVVVDEAAGIFLAFFGVPINPASVILGFAVYRLLDIAKPFPVRRLERLPGSWGIMLDDFLCAIYANAILQVFLKSGILH